MANCSNEFPKTEVLYKESISVSRLVFAQEAKRAQYLEQHLGHSADISGDIPIIIILIISCILSLLCLLVFLEEIKFLYRGYLDNPSRITTFIVLLGLYPVISILALISLLVPRSTVLTDLLASCYLSVCVYTFVSMMIDYFGGEEAMVRAFKEDKILLNTPPCCCICCCILKPITLTRSSLFRIKLCSLQVIIIRPLVLFIAAVLWTDGKYEQGFSLTSGYTYIAIISAISTLLSMYGMIVIYRASRLKLQHYSLTMKFVPLQLCVVLVNLQNIIFNGLAQRGVPGCNGTRGPRVRMAAIQHLVLILEMAAIAFVARRGYRQVERPQMNNTDASIDSKQIDGIVNISGSYGSFQDL